MGRRIAACAALVALMVSLSACACGRATTKTAGAAAPAGSVCLPSPCVKGHDCTACYQSESDRDMARRWDNEPYGGCCDCAPVILDHHRYHDCVSCGE